MEKHIHRLKYYGVRVAGVCLSAYLALCLSEFILWRMQPMVYRAFYGDLHAVKDGNAVLQPGYDGRFDLGGATIETRSATIEILVSGLALFSNHRGAGTAPPIGKLSLESNL